MSAPPVKIVGEHKLLDVQFFARLRELHGASALQLPDEQCPATVGDLRALVQSRVSPALAEALAAPNVLCAVNQQLVDDAVAVVASDEIAFFPPVTGG